MPKVSTEDNQRDWQCKIVIWIGGRMNNEQPKHVKVKSITYDSTILHNLFIIHFHYQLHSVALNPRMDWWIMLHGSLTMTMACVIESMKYIENTLQCISGIVSHRMELANAVLRLDMHWLIIQLYGLARIEFRIFSLISECTNVILFWLKDYSISRNQFYQFEGIQNGNHVHLWKEWKIYRNTMSRQLSNCLSSFQLCSGKKMHSMIGLSLGCISKLGTVRILPEKIHFKCGFNLYLILFPCTLKTTIWNEIQQIQVIFCTWLFIFI